MNSDILFWWQVQDIALLAFITFPIWGYALACIWEWLDR